MKFGHVQPVIVTDSEIDRGHPVEIGGIELTLATGTVAHRLAKDPPKQIDDRVENRHMWDPALGAAALEFGAQVLINNTHQQNARIAVNPRKDSVDMVVAADKCPDMFSRPHVGKLGDTGARDLVYGLACGIRHQMNMQGRVIHVVKLGCPVRAVTGFHALGTSCVSVAAFWG